MSRPRSSHPDLAAYPRLKARALKTKTRYYYRHSGGREEPLGDNLLRAIERYHQIEEKGKAPGTIAQMCDAFEGSERFQELAPKTRYEYTRALRRLATVFGAGTFEDFRPEHLSRYVKLASAKTRAKRDIACLSAMWGWARAEGLTDLPNPRYGMILRSPKVIQPGVTPEQFEALYAASEPPLQDLLDLLYLTGQDVNVVLGWKRTDIKDGCLETTRTKTGKPIRIELAGEFGTVIQRCLTRPRTATGPWIVQTDKGQRLTYAMLRKRLDKARKASGVHFELRAIRRQTASDSESLTRAQELLGHEDSKTTRRHYRRGERVKALK
jgi:integrase